MINNNFQFNESDYDSKENRWKNRNLILKDGEKKSNKFILNQFSFFSIEFKCPIIDMRSNPDRLIDIRMRYGLD